MRKFAIALAAISLFAIPASVAAAPCKDAKGKFVKCPPTKTVAPTKKAACRDAKGKFIKCAK